MLTDYAEHRPIYTHSHTQWKVPELEVIHSTDMHGTAYSQWEIVNDGTTLCRKCYIHRIVTVLCLIDRNMSHIIVYFTVFFGRSK